MSRKFWVVATCVLAAAGVLTGLALKQNGFLGGAQGWSSLWATLIATALVIVFIVVSETRRDFLSYFSFALCGGSLGWVLGILANPATSQEERVFGEYKTAIMAFISGFAVTKLNDIWKILTADKPPLLLQPAVLSRVLVFSGMAFLLVAQQYNVRQGAAGAVIVSAAVTPREALLDRTAATLTVAPGSSIQFKGAAQAEDMSVEWRIGGGPQHLLETVKLEGDTLAIPTQDLLQKNGVNDGDTLRATAMSNWNHGKTAALDVKLKFAK